MTEEEKAIEEIKKGCNRVIFYDNGMAELSCGEKGKLCDECRGEIKGIKTGIRIGKQQGREEALKTCLEYAIVQDHTKAGAWIKIKILGEIEALKRGEK